MGASTRPKKTSSPATSPRSSAGASARGGSANAAKRPTLEPPPDRDPGGQWERAVRKLAADAGVNADVLVEEWDERAALRTWCGGMSLDDANHAAFEDVKSRLFPPKAQPALFEDAA